MSHLDYYVKHEIAPVHYDLSDLTTHFQRREALYRTLGLLPLAFKAKDVLEVAAGTGQNSLYIASLGVKTLTLLEPNPTGIKAIKESYATTTFSHTSPTLIESKLEEYQPATLFDIVLCENWLGNSTHERNLLKRLADFVAPRGVLVVTCVAPIGFIPNIIRRSFAAKLISDVHEFSDKTAVLVKAFAGHLASIKGMSRSAADWVQDNMLNPAYFDLCLTVPMVIEDLGPNFQAAGVSPGFWQDRRWFKAICGDGFDFNQNLLDAYTDAAFSFLDYRQDQNVSVSSLAVELDQLALELVSAVRDYEGALHEKTGGTNSNLKIVLECLHRIEALFSQHNRIAALAITEACALLEHNQFTPEMVSRMQYFSKWFGRETIYISMERTEPKLREGTIDK